MFTCCTKSKHPDDRSEKDAHQSSYAEDELEQYRLAFVQTSGQTLSQDGPTVQHDLESFRGSGRVRSVRACKSASRPTSYSLRVGTYGAISARQEPSSKPPCDAILLKSNELTRASDLRYDWNLINVERLLAEWVLRTLTARNVSY